MAVTIVSTTDTEKDIQAAVASTTAAPKVDETTKPDVTEKVTEKVEASGASETTDESTASESSEESDGQKPKKKNGFKKRIEKLNARVAAKQGEADYWKNEALRNQKPEVQEKKPITASTDSTGRPKSDDFESHDSYIEALTDWKVDQKDKAKDSRQKETDAKTQQQKQIEKYGQLAKEFSKAHPDFQEVVEDVTDIPMSLAVQALLLESDNGPELAYALAKDKDEYARICGLSPLAAARAIGRMEAKIVKEESSTASESTVNKTKAPKPISPVGSKSSSTEKSPDDMDFKEFERWREKNLRKA